MAIKGNDKSNWEDMKVTFVGEISEVIQVAHGTSSIKTVVLQGDPGEPQKNPQQDT